MFEVPIDKIMPVTIARAKISSLVRDVQNTKSLFVLTRGGKPAAILASIDYIKNINTNNTQIKTAVKDNEGKLNLSKNTTSISQKIDTNNSTQKNQNYENTLANLNQNEQEKNSNTNTVDSEQPVKISIK